MNPTSIYTHALVAIFAAIFAAGGAWKIQNWRYENIISEMKAAHAEEIAKAENDARLIENKWQADAAQSREEKNREIIKIRSSYIAAINSMRNRPERPSGDLPDNSKDGNVAAGCDGEKLYRPDAEFLIGEAARADEIRLSLLQCYSQYNSLLQNTLPQK